MSRIDTVHGTAVAISGLGVLLLGKPGCGKSDLALRLIDRGALLVADDQVRLSRSEPDADSGPVLTLASPGAMPGMMEIRGIGVAQMPHLGSAPFTLAVLCDAPPERLPAPEHRQWLGVPISAIRLVATEPSAPIKLEWALRAMVDGASGKSKETAVP